jgi:hypothetical protein
LSNAIQVFLEMQGVEMMEGDVWGHRKDLDEYFTMEDSTLEEIRALGASGASADDVANQIQKKGQDRLGANQVHRQDQDYRLSRTLCRLNYPSIFQSLRLPTANYKYL